MGPPGPGGDSGLYHLPAVRWYLAFPAVPGLGNVHDRLGFNSSYFLYAALLDTGPSPVRCFHLANGLLVAALMAQLLLGLFSAARDWGRARLSDLLQALLIFPLLIAARSPYFVSSIAPNAAIFVLGIIVGVQLLEFLLEADEDPQRLRRLYTIVFLSCVGITVKLSFLAFGVVASATALGIWFIRARQRGGRGLRNVGALSFACAALPLAPWVIHGIILTGYVAFPSTVGAMPVDWRVPRSVALRQQRLIYSWARKPWADPAEVLGNWRWLQPWLRDNIPRPLIIGPCVLALLGGLFIVASWLRNRLIVRGRAWLFFLTPAAGLAFWFVMAPAPDFAGAAFVLLGCGAAAFALAPHCGAAVQFLSSPGGRRMLAWCCALVICAAALMLISGKSAAVRTLRRERSLPAALACLGVNSEFVMGHPFYDRLQPAPRQPYKTYVTNSGLVVYVPTHDVFCWEIPLPSAPGPVPRFGVAPRGPVAGRFCHSRQTGCSPMKVENRLAWITGAMITLLLIVLAIPLLTGCFFPFGDLGQLAICRPDISTRGVWRTATVSVDAEPFLRLLCPRGRTGGDDASAPPGPLRFSAAACGVQPGAARQLSLHAAGNVPFSAPLAAAEIRRSFGAMVFASRGSTCCISSI